MDEAARRALASSIVDAALESDMPLMDIIYDGLTEAEKSGYNRCLQEFFEIAKSKSK